MERQDTQDTMVREATMTPDEPLAAANAGIAGTAPPDAAPSTAPDTYAENVAAEYTAGSGQESRMRGILGNGRRFFGRTIGLALYRSQEFFSHRTVDTRRIAAAAGIGALTASALRIIRRRQAKSAGDEGPFTSFRRKLPFGG